MASGGGKSKVEMELDELREKGLAKSHKTKYSSTKGAPLSTPEQAFAFLAAQKAARKMKRKVDPPKNLNSNDLDSWYMQQRAQNAEMKRRQLEAAAILRGYRASSSGLSNKDFTGSNPAASSPSPTKADVKSTAYGSSNAPGKLVLPNFKDNESEPIASRSTDEAEIPPSLEDEEEADFEDDENLEELMKGYMDAKEAEGAPVPVTDEGEVDAAALLDAAVEKEEKSTEEDLENEAPGLVAVVNEDIIEGAEETTNDMGPAENETEKESSGDDSPENVEESGVTDEAVPTEGEEAPEPEGKSHEPVEEDNGEVAVVLAGAGDNTGNEEKKSDDSDLEQKEKETEGLDSAWRESISSEQGAKFPSESGRYHLYASYACPWAHRALMVWALKGLEDAISISILHPIWRKTNLESSDDKHIGWVFGNPDGEPFRNSAGLGGPFPPAYPGNDADPIFNAYSIRDLYERADDTFGKYTLPVLWDKERKTIVNNESSDIIRILNSEFNEFAKNPDLDLYPKDQQGDIDKINEWVHPKLNNAVYKCGFATSQEAYDDAIGELTESFDRVDSILQKQKYITGDTFTEADVRLFVTLLRWDEVSSIYMKTNTRSVATTPAILNYCRDIYRISGVAKTCHMDQIKAHYYCSHVELNRYSIIPRGSDFMDLLCQNNDKEE
eukprot:CAMPEP_0185728136 /NCGR_PEP_ID=MMETSP1171-20130828/3593_1 /TAXON_ID=374046 /ORGANISM="Helicotheca tamensis, Strain CCMP826" /LENGTH=668 /DNA_ID=CAMNT_0028396811 /DNA_START=128 /DNA_END=2134 /DNA_ORIENTATION=+